MANKLGESQQQQQQNKQQKYDNNNKIQCKNITNTSATITTDTAAAAASASEASINSNNNNAAMPITTENQQDNDMRMTINEKKNFLLEHAKLVAEYYPDYNNMRMTNGPPDVFVDVALNGNNHDSTSPVASAITTTTSTSAANGGGISTATTTTTSSSFSFKHFLSNSSRDMTAPSSTVTSLDPIIISNNNNNQQQHHLNGLDINNTGSCSNNNNNHNKSQSSCSLTAISDPTKPYQTSTGARPKIPQSNSVSTTSICTLMNNTRLNDAATAIIDNNNVTAGNGNIFQNCNTKMKRSPRFSSFDSQASLAEFVGVDSDSGNFTATSIAAGGADGGYYTASDAKLQHLLQSDYATIANANHNNASAVNSIDLMCKLVPRSYSNYDMPLTNTTSGTPRRRIGVFNMDCSSSNNSEQQPNAAAAIFGCFSKEARPTRLSLNINNKFKFDLDQTHNNNNSNNNMNADKCNDDGHVARHMDMNNHEIGGVAASALPDFVQDHWLEAWHVQESMRLNSPATSPVEGASGIDSIRSCNRGRLAPAKLALIGKQPMNLGASNFCGVIGDKRQIHTNNHINEPPSLTNSSLLSRAMGEQQQLTTNNHNTHNNTYNNQNYHHEHDNNPRQHNMPLSLGLGDQEMGLVNADIVANAAAERNAANSAQNSQSNTVGCKMLPDFLADGPIIHSAQRLADVAAGLPPNSVGSPEESSMMTQITNLRLDNERLVRELSDIRMALNEQTRRANQLDRQLLQQQQQYQQQQQQQHKQKDTLDASTTTTETDNNSDNIAPTYLNDESEIVALRLHVSDLTAEMEKLRRENAVLREGGAVGGGGGAATSTIGTRTPFMGRQPRNRSQFSKDLMRAASNAESNLRQLLTGVENLRQMANEIQNTDWHEANNAEISPDVYPEYFDDCNDPYEEYRTGSAL